MTNSIPFQSLALALTLGLASVLPTALSAQVAETQERTEVYPPEFFAQYTPDTAWDMVARIPGFALDRGEDARGFGTTAGNVLIDGVRPTTKSGGIEDALRRIPAAQVARIEVLSGALSAGETAGQAVVANIIRSSGPRTTRWQLSVERASSGDVYAAGQATVADTWAQWQTSLNATVLWERLPRTALLQTTDRDNTLLQSQTETQTSSILDAFVSGDAHRAIGDGTVRLNGRFGWSRFNPRTGRFGFESRLPDDTPDTFFLNVFDNKTYEAEIGADWSQTLASGWTWRLVGLSTGEFVSADSDNTTEDPIGSFEFGTTSRSNQDRYEAVLRSTIGKTEGGALRPEFGGEFAYNRLDSEFDLRIIDPEGETPIPIPAADVVVEEFRGDVFANVIWRFRPKLSLDLGTGFEVSRIQVSGDAENDQSFFFWKPSVALTYDHSPTLQYRLSARHTVGQLDFGDFATAADLVDERVIAGNPELKPDQTTRVDIGFEHRSASQSSINLALFHEWRRDVLEQIPLVDGAQGTGNAGDARLWGLTTNLSQPLGKLIPNGLLDINATIRESSFDDPVTGENRELTTITRPQITADFRQDLSQYQVAWGLGYRSNRTTRLIFVDEINKIDQDANWSAFIETTRFRDLKFRLSVLNLNVDRQRRTRSFFDPDRAGDFTGREVSQRRRGAFITLTVSGAF